MERQRYKYLDLGDALAYQVGDEPGKPTGFPCGRQWQVSRRRFDAEAANTSIGRIAKADGGYWYATPLMDRSPMDGDCPARHIGRSKAEVVAWLQGVHDAGQTWFQRGVKEAAQKRAAKNGD